MANRYAQRGVAMITAIMVVAFAATVGGSMLVQQNLAVHRSANLFAKDQAWWYVVGLEEWAATLLDRDREDNQFDHLGELWAQPVDFLPVDEGALSGRLLDLQGRFNLRTLVNAEGQLVPERKEQLIRLLQQVENIPPGQAEDLASAFVDWMDRDTEPGFPGGAEDGVYLAKERPYRAANQPPASLSELLLIEGVDKKIYTALLPHLCLHPGGSAINVNTATLPVLMSLHPDLSRPVAEAIMDQRVQTPYEDVDSFLTDNLVGELGLTADLITIQSHYFLAEGSANIGKVRLNYVSLLERPEGGRTHTLAHSLNAL